ncbi:MAG: glycosyltransferase [Halobacteriales archaeon]|nr:glycosyltransferase [Halobacteriales archaeon]
MQGQAGAARVAIVIPTANPEREPARSAIARARATSAHLGATVHVVVSSGPGFRFSRSVNRGMAEAPDADFWVLLNDDCFMDEGWLDRMVEASRSHPEAGVVGAVLRFPDGKLQHAGGYLLDPWRYLLRYTIAKRAPFWAIRSILRSRRHGRLYCHHYFRLRASHRLDLVTGACMLIPRATRERLGGYDEGYEFSYEDVDYCLRALKAGLEIALAVEATGMHVERATGGSLYAAMGRSEARLNAVWGRERVLELTRRNGRRGIHHGTGRFASCECGNQVPA